MGEIKSALEIALERAERIGKASKEELEQSRWKEEARKAAVKFMNGGEGEVDLKEALSGFPPQAIPTAIETVSQVLARNIFLPREKEQWATIDRALKGLQQLKGSAVLQIIDNIRYLLQTYQQTREQYKEQLKMRFQGQIDGVKQALAQQYGMGVASRLDAEALPEFQQEWSKISGEIDSQFQQQLDQLKGYLTQ